MKEDVYEAIEYVFREDVANVSQAINRIESRLKRSLDFKDVTEIARLIEPQLSNRNVLKLLLIDKKEKE